MTEVAEELLAALTAEANPAFVPELSRFFKTGPGQYGENDCFLGLRMAQQRHLAKQFAHLSPADLSPLLQSPWHEVRMTAALIVLQHYQRSKKNKQNEKFVF